jgi:hypothetical protein
MLPLLLLPSHAHTAVLLRHPEAAAPRAGSHPGGDTLTARPVSGGTQPAAGAEVDVCACAWRCSSPFVKALPQLQPASMGPFLSGRGTPCRCCGGCCRYKHKDMPAGIHTFLHHQHRMLSHAHACCDPFLTLAAAEVKLLCPHCCMPSHLPACPQVLHDPGAPAVAERGLDDDRQV